MLIRRIPKPDDDQYIQFNRYNGRKKYLNIAAITTDKGVPLSYACFPGKQSDCLTVSKMISLIPINTKSKELANNNRFKQYFAADANYFTKNNEAVLRSKGYTSLVRYNRRTTTDEEIIQRYTFTDAKQKKYKKRIIVESFFSWIKNYPSINQNYQKSISSYNGLLSLACSLNVSKNIIAEYK